MQRSRIRARGTARNNKDKFKFSQRLGNQPDPTTMSQASVVDDGDGDVVMAGYNFVEDCVLVRPAGFPRDRVTEKEDSITVLRAIDVWKRPHSPRFRHRRHSLHQVGELTNSTA